MWKKLYRLGDVIGAVGCDIMANDALALITSSQYLMLILIIVITSIIIFFYWIIKRMVTKPIRRVVEAITKISDNSYTIDKKLLERHDELGILAKEIENVRVQTSEVLNKIVNAVNMFKL